MSAEPYHPELHELFERMPTGPVRYTGALDDLYRQYVKERAYVDQGLTEAEVFANEE